MPHRRNNLNGDIRIEGDEWDSSNTWIGIWNNGTMVGEDSCGDTHDFTVDFDDRGMNNNQRDGTDWGRDDTYGWKCGHEVFLYYTSSTAYWQIWIR